MAKNASSGTEASAKARPGPGAVAGACIGSIVLVLVVVVGVLRFRMFKGATSSTKAELAAESHNLGARAASAGVAGSERDEAAASSMTTTLFTTITSESISI